MMYYRHTSPSAKGGICASEAVSGAPGSLEEVIDDECFLRDDEREAREMYLRSHHDRIDDN